MKTHTSDFKNTIKTMGRQIDSIITYGNTVLHDELYSVTPHYEADILKSVMKQLDIKSSVNIALGTVLNYQLGVKVGNSYEYLNYGNYVVYSVEKIEDSDAYNIICYDKMLYSMKDYESLGVTYPITLKNFLSALATKIGLTLKNTTFQNQSIEISKELYLDIEGNSLGYTFRDVLDEIAQATGSIICISPDDKIEVRYPTSVNDTINEDFLKSVNVKFGEKYGPINSIVLSRSAESDNVYLRDENSVIENGLCEVKILDNQIMNWNDRSDYLQGILTALNGLYYYVNDFNSTGVLYYDLGDIYNIVVGETTYQCLMLNDEINVTQGLEEIIHTDMPVQSETDYSKADKTDRRINQAYSIVDKQGLQITNLIRQIGNREGETSSITEQINEMNINISGVTNQVTQKGGNNLFYYSTEFWNTDDTLNLEEYTNTDFFSNTVSGRGYIVNDGSAYQDTNITHVAVPNGKYTVSFLYKKIGSSITHGSVKINDIEYSLTESNWTKFAQTIDVTTNHIKVEFVSDADNVLYVADLLGNIGEEPNAWTQNPNETRTDTVSIGKGIQVESSEKNTYYRIDADGNRTFNKATGEVVNEATDKGTNTKELIVRDKAEIAGLLIQEINGQIWLSSLL